MYRCAVLRHGACIASLVLASRSWAAGCVHGGSAYSCRTPDTCTPAVLFMPYSMLYTVLLDGGRLERYSQQEEEAGGAAGEDLALLRRWGGMGPGRGS